MSIIRVTGSWARCFSVCSVFSHCFLLLLSATVSVLPCPVFHSPVGAWQVPWVGSSCVPCEHQSGGPWLLARDAAHSSSNDDGKFHSSQCSQWLLLFCIYICLLSPGKILPKLPFRVQLRGAGREKVPTRNLAGWTTSCLFPSNVLGNPFAFCQVPIIEICPHYCATLFSLLRSALRADNLPIMTNLKLENGHAHFKNSLFITSCVLITFWKHSKRLHSGNQSKINMTWIYPVKVEWSLVTRHLVGFFPYKNCTHFNNM